MQIRSLKSIAFAEVISCFLASFENYFVPLPAESAYWEKRFRLARVDWELSFGIFDKNKLVGFVIHGIDNYQNFLTAYNTGTGILPAYRGQGLTTKIYDHALPVLKRNGIRKVLLEVIVENDRGIKAYQKSGFSITRTLRSFSGEIAERSPEDNLEEVAYEKVLNAGLYHSGNYSWDNAAEAIKVSDDVRNFLLSNPDGKPAGYFSLDASGNLLQLESVTENFSEILKAIGVVNSGVRIKNVPAHREELIAELFRRDFVNTVNQYEMELDLANPQK